MEITGDLREQIFNEIIGFEMSNDELRDYLGNHIKKGDIIFNPIIDPDEEGVLFLRLQIIEDFENENWIKFIFIEYDKSNDTFNISKGTSFLWDSEFLVLPIESFKSNLIVYNKLLELTT